jgi:hypothetical protein
MGKVMLPIKVSSTHRSRIVIATPLLCPDCVFIAVETEQIKISLFMRRLTEYIFAALSVFMFILMVDRTFIWGVTGHIHLSRLSMSPSHHANMSMSMPMLHLPNPAIRLCSVFRVVEHNRLVQNNNQKSKTFVSQLLCCWYEKLFRNKGNL